MRVAITGATGFIGSSIVQGLAGKFNFAPIPSLKLFEADFVKQELTNTSTLIHLAGISSVGDCEKDLGETYKVNVGLPCYLAELFFRQNKGGHFIFASTGQVYDETEPVPHSENTKIAPNNSYARSKLCAEVALNEIARQLAGRLTILRLYNHTHKSQSTRFVLPSIYNQIINSDSQFVHLKVGNIDVERDFSSRRDLINAFYNLLNDKSEVLQHEVYNLSSGVGKNLRQMILEIAAREGKSIEFEVDPTRVRPNEPKKVIGDSTKFQTRFGWKSDSQSIGAFLNLFLEDEC